MYSSKVGYELVANCCRSVNVECLLTKIKKTVYYKCCNGTIQIHEHFVWGFKRQVNWRQREVVMYCYRILLLYIFCRKPWDNTSNHIHIIRRSFIDIAVKVLSTYKQILQPAPFSPATWIIRPISMRTIVQSRNAYE